jgi:hypothetical protein
MAECAVCRDVVLAARGMQAVAKALETKMRLPDGNLL